MSEEKNGTAEVDESSSVAAGAEERLDEARERFDEAISGVEKRVRGIRKGASRASERVREKAGKASESARQKYEEARDTARHGYDRVTKDLDELSDDVGEYIRHNPGKSVAIALGVGFLIGVLLRPRRD
jgi:ElaB/YqjD/DUF883 family membrane-anchored ribosome-binding protein